MSSFLPALTRLFDQGHALVFWNDAEGEFAAQLEEVSIEGVTVLRMDRTPALQAKIWIERQPGARWLIYAPSAEPEPAQDWLLDARLRGKTFSADSASIQLQELGLADRSLREHLKLRARFLRARERCERLKRWVHPADTAEDLDRKMMAVVLRAETADPSAILLKLLAALAEGEELGARPEGLDELAAVDLEAAFWRLLEREFAYHASAGEAPGLRGVLYSLLATDFCSALRRPPASLAHFVVAERAAASNVTVFVSRWRSDIANFRSYDLLSGWVAEDLKLVGMLGALDAEALREAMTFEAIEKRVIADLKTRILAGSGANMDSVRDLIARRRDGHWANPLLAGANDSKRALAASYDALEAAAGFFELQARYRQGFSFVDAHTAFHAYRSELYRFDQGYRWFMRAAETVEPTGWALLHELRERMEDAYSGWFVAQLASAWTAVLEGPAGLLATWKLDSVINQQHFYARHVAPALAGGAKRVFVIISDAFRFEAAAELLEKLNSRSRVKARLEAMLGVLPSYTTLGMASLLPHQRLAYKDTTALDVAVDGQSASTLEQRSAILAAHRGVAISRDALMEKGKDRGREFVKPWKLIYVYHDLIDMIGDKRGSESKTFEATANAIRELAELVSFIVNNLNGSTVFITADHGFLYQESALDEADRHTLQEGMPGVLKSKKRYVLGRGLWPMQNAWAGNTHTTAGTDAGAGSLDFRVPKGAGRFHFVGGARFVHGSAMPQEVVLPVIVVKESDSEKTRTRQVEVSLLGSSNKVVTNKQRFEFIQTEAVSERVLPVSLLFSIRDGDASISDEQILTFDSTSPLLEERKRSIMLTLAAGSYDRGKDYFLVARDAKTRAEAWRAPLRIDIAFSNDF